MVTSTITSFHAAAPTKLRDERGTERPRERGAPRGVSRSVSRVVLGVTGGIASYKAVWLARLLTESGVDVDVVMTAGAREFVGPITFEAVTGRRVHTDIFEAGHALDHIRLAREADAILIAPATADFVARAAHGRADDLLSAILLAAQCPVVIAPAMNDRMWAHPQTQLNIEHLRELGYTVIDPDIGPLAFGEGTGPGRLPEPTAILAYFEKATAPAGPLRGQQVIVTAGATREAIDPVRFISNHSSGKMGIAIAEAALRRGANVTLIVGHVDTPIPPGAKAITVTTTADMQQAVLDVLPVADVLIMAAAPADFTARDVPEHKIKKAGKGLTIELTEAPDILKSTLHARRPSAVVVGFALETQSLVSSAQGKLRDKQLDLIVANQAGVPGSGFGTDTNRVTFIGTGDSDTDELPELPKFEVAERLLDRVEHLLTARHEASNRER